MNVTKTQQDEFDKYIRMYRERPQYQMGVKRTNAATILLKENSNFSSFLDIGCGRGEMLDVAFDLGFTHVHGVDVVPDLLSDLIVQAPAWNLPFGDKEFDVVACNDVMEHILHEDMSPTLNEIERVAKHTVMFSIANNVSGSKFADGTRPELHVNILPYDEWDRILREVFSDWNVVWRVEVVNTVSQSWVCQRL
jgi:ubiquinone/menaquinone biosynthesis C-methylase UbiE